ncbi:hypothetical protein WA026_014165 [Henosepilachna vigintioctopunctata]|uniref:Ubiquitin-like modifier-activating enzyme ATG7 n=1 Tax=Henosepilachna vigintioctopunctata TaxID=420089 RepID=A0AAW1TLV5_9CUCU
MTTNYLEFVPVSSSINPSFWNKLSEIKLNIDKLVEIEHHIWGYFSHINDECKVPILEVNSTSFNTNFESQRIYIPFHGRILNMNTIEQFKDSDKTTIIHEVGERILQSIESGEALLMPSILNHFYVLSFVDLKKFNFYYWFAFPVPRNLSVTCNNVKIITDVFTDEQLQELWLQYCELECHQKPYFFVHLVENSVRVEKLQSKIDSINEVNYEEYYFTFYDISRSDNCPGSPLRNYIALILHKCPFLSGISVNFIAWRLERNEASILTISKSLIFQLKLPYCRPSLSSFVRADAGKGWVGWEKNERGKLGPRLSSMKGFMDPKELAESSVDLNLKLMKWRLVSNIDLEKIKQTNFLLLGSGTLGCSVARILLGWGARNISFVDNSNVAYSNPVRQSLFTFEDSKHAKPKSLAAADNLRKIFPGKSKSFQLTIPMPGHTVGDSMLEEVKKDVEKLTSLIKEHDVIFLLMDSRESRWLPTLLGSYFKKIVINAALGFDSFLVMRHGVRLNLDELRVRQYPLGFKGLKGNYLGCYFCNDVTAPGDSTKGRTLDQQCTVTRPGLSAIAGALSAELAISLLHHKEGAKAPAYFQIGYAANRQNEILDQCVLGLLPHSIRGYLSTFTQVLPATERYKLCVACSNIVQDAYAKDGFDFLLKVFQNSKFLEDITGLTTSNKDAEDIGIWELSDEEEVESTTYLEKSEADTESRMSNSSVEASTSRDEITVRYNDFCDIKECGQNTNSTETSTKASVPLQINQHSTEEQKNTTESNNSGELKNAQNTIREIINKAEMNFQRSPSEVDNITTERMIFEEGLATSRKDIADQDLSHPLIHASSKKIVSILENKNIISSAESLNLETEITDLEKTNITKQSASEHELINQVIPKSLVSSSSKLASISNRESTLQSQNISTNQTRFSSSFVKFNGILNKSATSTSTSKNSKICLPNELIPILEKQRAVSSARFIMSKQVHSKYEDNIISLKHRVDNFVSSSESFIRRTEEEIDEHCKVFHHSTLCNRDMEKMNVPIGEGMQTNKKELYSQISPTKHVEVEKNMIKPKNESFRCDLTNSKTYNADLITLKSNVQCLISSDSINSSDNDFKCIAPNESIKSSILDHLKKRKELLTIIANNLITSSESQSSNEVAVEQVDKHFLNTSSLDSENLKMNDSVYYLAESDSNKLLDDQ